MSKEEILPNVNFQVRQQSFRPPSPLLIGFPLRFYSHSHQARLRLFRYRIAVFFYGSDHSLVNIQTHITVIDDCAGSPQGPPVLQLSNSSIISAAVVSGSTSTSTNGATKTTTSSTSCVIFKPTNLTQNSVHQIREREKQIVSGIASSFYAMLKAPPTAEPAIVSQPVPEKKESVEKKKSTPLTFSTDSTFAIIFNLIFFIYFFCTMYLPSSFSS